MKISMIPLLAVVSWLLLHIPVEVAGQTNGVPQFAHIVVVIGENTDASAVFGDANAPYINALANDGAKFTRSYALFHPSQPNYLGLYSGSNQGVMTDAFLTTPFTTPNLGRALLDALKTYSTYSEGLPFVGYNGKVSGKYVRKHNPAANWMGTGANQLPASTNQPFSAFPADYNHLPSVAFVVPDLCSDGHNHCAPLNNSIKQYDTWIKNNLDGYKQWCKDHNSLLIVTYDEDENIFSNKIATVFYGAHVSTGVYNQTINHYNVLRTLEDANGLTTHAGGAATSSPINYCWKNASNALNTGDALSEIILSAYPNPVISTLNISFQLKKTAVVKFELYNLLGQLIYTGKDKLDGRFGAGIHTLQINNQELSKSHGILLLKVTVDGKPKSILLTKVEG